MSLQNKYGCHFIIVHSSYFTQIVRGNTAALSYVKNGVFPIFCRLFDADDIILLLDIFNRYCCIILF